MTNSPQADLSWDMHHDLNAVLSQTETLWKNLRGARIFISGGTGFIGCCLLEALHHLDIVGQLNLQVTILTRSPDAFALKVPHLAAYTGFAFLQGDVTNFVFPPNEFSHIIHGATDASAYLNEHDPLSMVDTIVQGTRRVLELAKEKRIERVLFLSSGAVYGQQPWDMEHVAETYLGAPSSMEARNAYAEAKRTAEMLVAIYAKQHSVSTVTARIFTLLGPYLALGVHFAVRMCRLKLVFLSKARPAMGSINMKRGKMDEAFRPLVFEEPHASPNRPERRLNTAFGLFGNFSGTRSSEIDDAVKNSIRRQGFLPGGVEMNPNNSSLMLFQPPLTLGRQRARGNEDGGFFAEGIRQSRTKKSEPSDNQDASGITIIHV